MILEDYIKLEQTKALYNNLNLILIGTMGVVGVTTWVFWGNVATTNILAWFIAACVLNFFRWYSCQGFRADKTDPKKIPFWLNLHVFWGL